MKIREVLEKVKSPIPCCSSCEEDKDYGFGNDIEGCCCRHISPAQAEQEIRGMIEGMKKKIDPLFWDCTSGEKAQYNQALTDITEKLFGEGS